MSCDTGARARWGHRPCDGTTGGLIPPAGQLPLCPVRRQCRGFWGPLGCAEPPSGSTENRQFIHLCPPPRRHDARWDFGARWLVFAADLTPHATGNSPTGRPAANRLPVGQSAGLQCRTVDKTARCSVKRDDPPIGEADNEFRDFRLAWPGWRPEAATRH